MDSKSLDSGRMNPQMSNLIGCPTKFASPKSCSIQGSHDFSVFSNIGLYPMLQHILYTVSELFVTDAHPMYIPVTPAGMYVATESASTFAVGIPNCFDPRPNPLTTWPEIFHTPSSDMGMHCEIESSNGAKPYNSGENSSNDVRLDILGDDGTIVPRRDGT